MHLPDKIYHDYGSIQLHDKLKRKITEINTYNIFTRRYYN